MSASTSFVLDKRNFVLIAVGFLTCVLGFILMSGGAVEDPKEFNPEIFNTQRLSIAPVIVLIGFIIVGVGVMLKPKTESATEVYKK
jgi:uncharacterized membrane protein